LGASEGAGGRKSINRTGDTKVQFISEEQSQTVLSNGSNGKAKGREIAGEAFFLMAKRYHIGAFIKLGFLPAGVSIARDIDQATKKPGREMTQPQKERKEKGNISFSDCRRSVIRGGYDD